MTQEVDLTGTSTAALDLKARYDIEAGLRLPVRGGVRRRHHLDQPRRHGRRRAVHPRRQRQPGHRRVVGGRVGRRARRPRRLRRRDRCSCASCYRTDGGVAPDGFFADEIVVTADGTDRATSGAEDGDEGWTLDGFTSTTGTETGDFDELLHRVEPQLRVVRQVPEDRSVQLRLRQHEAGLGGALQLPARPAHLVLGHLAG